MSNTSDSLNNYSNKYRPFVTRWYLAAPDTITLPLHSAGEYDFNVDWGDGTSDQITAYNQAEITHTYTTGGTKTITILGKLTRWGFNNGGDRLLITDVLHGGYTGLTSLSGGFQGCTNLIYVDNSDSWIIDVTDLGYTFRGCTNFNIDISKWDTSKVTSLSNTFYGATSFNQNISEWDVSNVISFDNTFTAATAFDQDLTEWDVSKGSNFFGMFLNVPLNTDVTRWDVSNASNLSQLFRGTSFNQDLSNWDVSNVSSLSNTFRQTPFNQNISNWDVSGVTTMEALFQTTPFNQNLSSWDMSNVSNAASMLDSSSMSTANYDATLIGWSTQTLKTGVTLGVSGLTYTTGGAAEAARTALLGKGWTIVGDSGI